MLYFDKLYISTDDKNNSMIEQLLNVYPNAELFLCDEITTIQFASTCKNVILSHGSFSAIIGYLAFFSDVYYPEYEKGNLGEDLVSGNSGRKIWFGDMFSIDSWTKIPLS